MTIGIEPTEPNTGFGYLELGDEIEPGVVRLLRFTEKPSRGRAEEFLRAGNYAWNSGIFVWRTSVFRRELERVTPEIARVRLVKLRCDAVDLDRLRADGERPRVATVRGEFGWSDVGSFEALEKVGVVIPEEVKRQPHVILDAARRRGIWRVRTRNVRSTPDVHSNRISATGFRLRTPRRVVPQNLPLHRFRAEPERAKVVDVLLHRDHAGRRPVGPPQRFVREIGEPRHVLQQRLRRNARQLEVNVAMPPRQEDRGLAVERPAGVREDDRQASGSRSPRRRSASDRRTRCAPAEKSTCRCGTSPERRAPRTRDRSPRAAADRRDRRSARRAGAADGS